MVMYSSHSEVTTAIMNKLKPGGVLDSVLSDAGIENVFNYRAVPDGQAYNYITFGRGREEPDHTLGENGKGYRLTTHLHIYLDEDINEGTTNIDMVINRLNELFDEKQLELASLHNVSSHLVSNDWEDYPQDGEKYVNHAMVTIRTFSQQS